MLNAERKGNSNYDTFKKARLGDNRSASFFDTIKKLNLKTFGSMNKNSIKFKDKEIVLTVDRNLFGKMVSIGQSRNLDMKEVLRYELGPFPWSIATCDGSLRKTNKAVLSTNLEQV